MNIMTIYGNPKDGGFVHGCLGLISERLGERGADVERLVLKDQNIQDCVGCFVCLRTGECPLPDAMNEICRRLRAADGFVVGCSVRNSTFTALYKRFWERISYTLGFTGDISDKHVLSVSAVGMMGGRKATRLIVGMTQFGSRLSDHLFFKTGIPTKLSVDDVRSRLLEAADKLYDRIESKRSPGIAWKLARRIDRFVMRRFLFTKSPEFYAHVIARYKQRGWM